jgi:hypothetical protein
VLDNFIVQNILWAVLAAAGSWALTRFRGHYQKKGDTILFFLATFVCLFVGITAYRVSNQMWKIQNRFAPLITPDTAEAVIRRWTDRTGWKVERTSGNEINYGFIVLLPKPGDVPVVVAESKGMPGFLTIQASVFLAPDHLARYNKLPKQAAHALNARLGIELNRLNFGYEGLDVPLETLTIFRLVPITQELTEFAFLDSLQQVLSGLVMVRNILYEELSAP